MRTLVCVLILGMVCSSGHAGEYNIKNLDIKDGLSSNYVISVSQDRRGFVWFATESGLNRFDGRNFRVFKKDPYGTTPESFISANELNKVYADRHDDVVWIATQRAGLNMFDIMSETFTCFRHSPGDPDGIITDDITDLVNARDGNLWISTYHRGVEYYDKETGVFTHYNTSTVPGLTNENAWSVNEDSKGNLYIGHVSSGLSVLSLRTGEIRNFVNDPSDPRSIPGNTVRAIFIDNDDNVWLGTDKGLALFNYGSGDFTVFRHDPRSGASLVSDYVLTITKIGGSLWVGTENGGVSIMDLRHGMFRDRGSIRFDNIRESADGGGLSDKTVHALFEDSFGNIWIGTYGGGVDFISRIPRYFNLWGYSPDVRPGDGKYTLSSKTAWGICADAADGLWVGTDGTGIDVYARNGAYSSYTVGKGGLPDNAVLSARMDHRGNMWFGTFAGGIAVYDRAKGGFIRPFRDSDIKDVRCFYEDDRHNMWIGTNGGLYMADALYGRITSYTMYNSRLPENNIRAICRDDDGKMWVGTFGQGLTVFSGDMEYVASANTGNVLLSNTIHQLYKDSGGRMWAATGEGLALFPDTGRPDSCVLFTERNGLVNGNVRAVTEDGEGTVWISTNGGISRLLPSFDKIYNYDRFDGVPSGNFMSGSVTKTSDGTIYFGSQNGLCFFSPKDIPTNIEMPATVISSLRVYGRGKDSETPTEVPVTKPVELKYDRNSFSVMFNVPDFALNDIVEYGYRLLGAGNQWYSVNDNKGNTADFRNIPPGKYVFEVRSRIKNQQWEEHTASLDILIRPPLWLMWWAKLLYVSAAAAIFVVIAFFYRRKLELENKLLLEKRNYQREQELNDERLRFFTNITHELRSPLTLILGPLEDLHMDESMPEKHSAKVNVIHKSANRLLALINQILEFRRTETQNKKLSFVKGDMAAVVQEAVAKYRELNRNGDLDIVVVTGAGDMEFCFDREAVTMMVDNLVSNSLKHTAKGTVTVALRDRDVDGETFAEIEVSDTGCGINAASIDKIFDRYYQAANGVHSGTGIGLALVKSLVTLHKGTILVASVPGEYTSFTIRLPKNLECDTAAGVAGPEIAEDAEYEYKAERQEAPDRRIIVLVVEDNDDIRDYICGSLYGFRVLQAKDGDEGLEMAFRHIPDIIISDIMMPGTDGITLCRRVKQDVRTSHIPVVLLTAKDTIQDKTEGYKAEADSYITKPFSSALLKSRIENLLEARRKLAEFVKNNTADKSVALKESIGALDSEFIDKVTAIIEKDIDSDKIEVNYLAGEMHMSHSTFYRKIKALTGISANEFIRKVRIRRAEQLLLTGRYNITEVSYMVGINSMKYFRQCFREEFGMTPSEYIRGLSEGE